MLVSVTLKDRFLNKDERALARAISLVESASPEGQALLRALRTTVSKSHIVGVTGSPGSGKSTLTDQLIAQVRAQGKTVAVIAVDPTSPYSGGAILGDRIRMMRWHQDPKVFIRSMATRGHLGGLAAASLQVLALLEAYGFDYIFIETVGVGQSEVDIVRVADTTLLVLTPGQGDGVQAFKAGIMEIADIFAINKYDLAGAQRLKREIKAALELSHPEANDWWPIIQETIALKGQYSDKLFEALSKHYQFLKETAKLELKKRDRMRFEISSLLTEQVRLALQAKEDDFIEAVLKGEKTVLAAAQELLASKDEF